MVWQHAGKHIENFELSYADYELDGEKKGQAVEIDGEFYLIRGSYCVPYFKPNDEAGQVHRTRERLNIELCDRVFRISDARDVERSGDDADEAIASLMQRFDACDAAQRRGVGRVLFGRLSARIRDLSGEYLREMRGHEDDKPSQVAQAYLDAIQTLYEYVMVEKREILDCVRLYNHSKDCDGVIEEVFSEIGKPQRQSLESIYGNRVIKIGAAMEQIDEVTRTILHVLGSITTLPLGEITHLLGDFSALARQLVGIPSSDHLAYDEVAGRYVNAHDAVHEAIFRVDHLNVMRGESHHLAEWLQRGIQLIDSMQNLRDGRMHSVASYREDASRWVDLQDEEAA